MRTQLLLAATLSCLFSASYAADGVKEAANRVASCIQSRNAPACRENITASSLELFNRFEGYDLMDCLPQKATYIAKKPLENSMQVRVQVTTNEKKSIVRLIFQQEEEAWKLDIPESLRAGIGNNWENELNATEQLYLMLKSQMGSNLNCGMIRNLASGLTRAQ